jgi:large conductance mechanosensitive channel protein
MPEVKIKKADHLEDERRLPKVKLPSVMAPFQGFVDFIRTQGVVGLAVGIVLGAQIKSLVDSFVASFVNPLLGLVLPGNGDLATKVLKISVGSKTAVFTWGIFLNQLISFVIVAAIVYFFVHGLKLDQLDKKKEK